MLNENDVIAAVCDHLQTLGYRIVSRCTTTDQGIDIVAEHLTGAERLLIEAKGGTSAREGSARFDKGFNTSQVRHQVAHGFYTAASLHTEHHGDVVSLAFPDTPTFRTYLQQIEVARQAVGIQVFMVKADRTVEVMPASGSQAHRPSHRNSEKREIAMKRNQRDVMRELYRQQGGNEERVVRAYAAAEQRGEVRRDSNTHNVDALGYARALLRDGLRKGWLVAAS